ncbi:MAG: Anaerobic sulfite reductase subunit [Planctomycetota bacterium]|jgi:NAD(P)H-flavin reductase
MTAAASLPPAVDADPWRSHPARILRITPEVPGVQTYELELRDPAIRDAYRFAAGQFNMLYLPGIGEAAISIASDVAAPAVLAHTVRAVGNVTDALARLAVGDEVLVRGPYGRPWPVAELEGRHVVVVGGGLGLASQRAAILQFARHRDRYRSVTILHGAKTPADLFYPGEYAAWETAGLDVRPTVDLPDGSWQGHVGLVTALFAGLAIEPERAGVLCCGPDPMMTAVARAAAGVGIAPADVYVSLERNMACAVRQCGLCQFGPAFVCQDGPVFPYDTIAKYIVVPHL